MKVLYFTATGNSLSVARKIGGTLISIPQALKTERFYYEDDVIGFVFPTYCGNVPRIVREFISRCQLKADYFFAVATHGNKMGYGNVADEFREYAAKYGYTFKYINTILMVDNYLDAFDITKEEEKYLDKEIHMHLSDIIYDIKAKKEYIKKAGAKEKMFTAFAKSMLAKIDKGEKARSFIIDEKCIKCGTCAKACPRGNISVSDKVEFGDNCESCYACLHICPKNALHLKTEKSNERWRETGISVQDIIDSNNQQKS